MRNIAVIGLGFGDEGKGMVTSSLVNRYLKDKTIVVRYSGGHQAGHTVNYNGISHTFANFGSGTLQDIPTYWSKACTVDPVGISNELKILVDKIDGYNIQLYINKDCPVTTPYDKFHNQNSKDNIEHGTCGIGFGSTIQREEDGFHLHFSDLFNPTIHKLKLKQIAIYYGRHYIPIDEYMEAVNSITNDMFFPNEIITPVDNIPDDFNIIIFEGSQGLLLDKDIGFFPHVTRSNVGFKGLAQFEFIDEIYYVTRAYQTRHGNGPMTNESVLLRSIEYESNKEHKYQGKFRTGILDLDLLQYAINNDRRQTKFRKENLVITCLDQIKMFTLIKNRKTITYKSVETFVDAISEALNIKNVYLSWSNNSEIIEKI